MKTTLLLFISVLNFNFFGMDYYIEANVKTPCKDDFPSGLSFFFEQVGGYEEKSMASQVEKILKIDLSTFQEYDYEDSTMPNKYWKNINVFEKTIDDLLFKIKANPNYFKKVKYNPVYEDYVYSSDKKDMEKNLQKMKEYEKNPLHEYPYNNGYLNSNKFAAELNQLKSLLKCYRKHGATKIKLSYM